MPSYLKGLDQVELMLKRKVRFSSDKLAYIKQMRERHNRYQRDLIPFVKDKGFQYRDNTKGGIVKAEGPKSVSEYLKLLFNL
jgi:hypothetical protein